MNSKNMYYLMAGDDITIVNCQTKLLILENTFTNQKMINYYVFSYHGKKIKGNPQKPKQYGKLNRCFN